MWTIPFLLGQSTLITYLKSHSLAVDSTYRQNRSVAEKLIIEISMNTNLFFQQSLYPHSETSLPFINRHLSKSQWKKLSSSQKMPEKSMHSVLTFPSMCHMLVSSHLIRPYTQSGCHGWHRYEVHKRADFVLVLAPCLHCDCHTFWIVMGLGWKACECHADP